MIDIKNNKKLGFSLLEALMSMLIVSLFFIASSRVITQKQKVEFQKNPRGYYECYIVNGGMWQHRAAGNASTSATQTNNCIFEPPSGVNFVNVHYFNGSEYFNSQQVILNERIILGGPSGVYKDEKVFNTSQSGQDAINQFKTYLRMSHPTSYIYKYWVEQGIQPTQATLIAW